MLERIILVLRALGFGAYDVFLARMRKEKEEEEEADDRCVTLLSNLLS